MENRPNSNDINKYLRQNVRVEASFIAPTLHKEKSITRREIIKVNYSVTPDHNRKSRF